MVQIPCPAVMASITSIWFLVRAYLSIKKKHFKWKREAQLLLILICILVVTRFTFFPFSKVNGKVQPLLFDAANLYPFRINLIPFVYLLDYPVFREAMLNLIGNISMFIPIGVIWPMVFKELDTHKKVIAAGAGFSLCVEILQLPFFDRVSDIDDLLLNTCGFLIGYGLYLLIKKAAKLCTALLRKS